MQLGNGFNSFRRRHIWNTSFSASSGRFRHLVHFRIWSAPATLENETAIINPATQLDYRVEMPISEHLNLYFEAGQLLNGIYAAGDVQGQEFFDQGAVEEFLFGKPEEVNALDDLPFHVMIGIRGTW